MVKRSIGAAATFVAVAAAAIWWSNTNKPVPQAAAQTPGQAIPVTAGTVAVEDVPVFLHGIGTVQAYNSVAIKSRVDGQIVRVEFKEGQDVKEGDLLFQIDPRAYQAALEQAQATKQKDEANLVGAQTDLDRYEKLLTPGWQTRQSYDQQKAQVAQLQASIKGDAAQIDAAKINLGYTEIRSPIDGRLGARLVDKGNIVHANDNTALVMITELKPIFVSFTLPQETLDDIHENNKQAPLVVRAYSGDGKKELAQGKLALGQLLLAVAAVGADHERSPLIIFVDLVEGFLRQSEADKDRLQLRDHDERGVVVRVYNIALVDEPSSEATIDRRTDLGVAKVDLGGIDLRRITLD